MRVLSLLLLSFLPLPSNLREPCINSASCLTFKDFLIAVFFLLGGGGYLEAAMSPAKVVCAL